ncbi:hypothetical protein IFM89_019296, partial [Coptis chinensis]
SYATYPKYQPIRLPARVTGPESFAFDCNRKGEVCDGSTDPSLESICGRPLVLQFNNATYELYIADAYFGLMSVGKNGGAASQLASSAEGVPFKFTNNMDIHPDSGIASDRVAERSKVCQWSCINQELYISLRRRNRACRVLRYWLEGPRANTIELFTQLPGAPDNIKRNARGDFWVALNDGQSTPSYTDKTIGVRVDEQGRHLESLHGNGYTESVSEINEYNGIFSVGSVAMPYLTIFSR